MSRLAVAWRLIVHENLPRLGLETLAFGLDRTPDLNQGPDFLRTDNPARFWPVRRWDDFGPMLADLGLDALEGTLRPGLKRTWPHVGPDSFGTGRRSCIAVAMERKRPLADIAVVTSTFDLRLTVKFNRGMGAYQIDHAALVDKIDADDPIRIALPCGQGESGTDFLSPFVDLFRGCGRIVLGNGPGTEALMSDKAMALMRWVVRDEHYMDMAVATPRTMKVEP